MPQLDPEDSAQWDDDIDDRDPSTIVPLGDWSFDPTEEGGGGPAARALLGGFADADSFFLILSAEIFEASVQLMYGRVDGKLKFIGGYVPLFKGDTMKAPHWLQDYGDALVDAAAEEPEPKPRSGWPRRIDRTCAVSWSILTKAHQHVIGQT